MNQNELPPQASPPQDEINLIDLIYPVYKLRKFLILFCLSAIILTGLWSFLLPKTYSTTAVLLLEDKGLGAGAELKAAFMQQYGIAGLAGTAGAKADVFIAILKSKELAGEVLRRYHYAYTMGLKHGNQDSLAQVFANTISVNKPKTQPTISITVTGSDPVLITDLANSYAVGLDKFNRMNTVGSAQNLRNYIEDRLKAVIKELDEAQDELRKFQEKNKAISISKQAEATLTVLAELESQRVALDVEKAAKEKFFGRPHIEIEQLKAKMDAIQRNINHLTYSNGSSVPIETEKGKVEFYIPLIMIPGLNFDESKLLLNIKAKTGVVSMLVTQLEQTKLEEAKDLSTINLLDPAKLPRSPNNTGLIRTMVFTGFVSVFLAILLIFFLEFLKGLNRNQEQSGKWYEMKNESTSAIVAWQEKKQIQFFLKWINKLKTIKFRRNKKRPGPKNPEMH